MDIAPLLEVLGNINPLPSFTLLALPALQQLSSFLPLKRVVSAFINSPSTICTSLQKAIRVLFPSTEIEVVYNVIMSLILDKSFPNYQSLSLSHTLLKLAESSDSPTSVRFYNYFSSRFRFASYFR